MYTLKLTVPSHKFHTTYVALQKRGFLGRNWSASFSDAPSPSVISWTYSTPARAKMRKQQVSEWLNKKSWDSRKEFTLVGSPTTSEPEKAPRANAKKPKSPNGVYVTRGKKR